MSTQIMIDMPYIGAVLSENHAFRRGNPRYGIFPEAKAWLDGFALLLRNQLQLTGWERTPAHVEFDLRMTVPMKVHRVDTQNFTRLLINAAAQVLGVDDSHFDVMTHAATKTRDKHKVGMTITISLS